MVKTGLILSLSVFLNFTASAQVTFQKTFGGENIDDAYSVQQTNDDGYIIAGYTLSFGEGSRDVYLIRTGVNGNVLWTKTYGGSDTDYAWAIQQTADSGYIIGAHSGSFGAGSHDVYLIKCDLNGNATWTKVYGGSNADGAYSLQQTTDGGYIIAAHVNSFGAGLHDVYLIKTNDKGDTLWTKTYGGSNEDRLRAVHQTTDGGYILVSETLSFGAGNADVYVVKTDSGGTVMWTRTFGGSSADYGYSVRQTTDGGYIIAGYTQSFGAGSTDVYLVKTDSSGTVMWTRTFGGSSADYGYSVRQTTDGGYIIAGHTQSFGTGGDVYLISTDASGDLLWTKAFGGSGTDYGRSVRQTADGGFVITGYTDSFGAGNKDVYLIKTDHLGNSGCNESATVTLVGNTATIVNNSTQTVMGSGAFIDTTATIVSNAATVDSLLCIDNPTDIDPSEDNSDPPIEQFNLFQSYPNPFNPSTTIEFSLPRAGYVTLKVFNMIGEVVATLVNEELNVGTYTTQWNASGVASGLYFYRMHAGDFIDTKKLLLLK